MLKEGPIATDTEDAQAGGDIFVSVEMSRLKWVVGLQAPTAEKVALHALTCGDVDVLLALIDRARETGGCGCRRAGSHRVLRGLLALSPPGRTRDPCRCDRSCELACRPPCQTRQDGSDRHARHGSRADGLSARRTAGGELGSCAECRAGGRPHPTACRRNCCQSGQTVIAHSTARSSRRACLTRCMPGRPESPLY